ncbi:hypothetical protein [Ilumatobacter sp.]|uniref:hypothetical protein n=1 Tax=Ilumatobacter sp. TaxID=1967498 RepID=UPI003B5231F8
MRWGPSAPLTVRCRFGGSDPSLQRRVVMATVDQLCAATDIGIDVLESLEIPLGEVMTTLWPYGIESVVVAVTGGDLHLTIELRTEPALHDRALFADVDGVVEAFFDVESGSSASEIELVGSLR